MNQTIRFVQSPHSSTRLGRPITLIVLHHTGGSTLEGTVRWFEDPESHVSAHYVVGKDGAIVQMVNEQLAAWHTGLCRWPGDAGPTRALNRESIGIEIVNRGSGNDPFPPEQLQALQGLLDELAQRYPTAQIVRHRDIAWRRNRKTDPADNFPWPMRGTRTDASDANTRSCPTCLGEGEVPSGVEEFGQQEIIGCPNCEGSGRIPATPRPTLRRGATGPAVAELQVMLRDLSLMTADVPTPAQRFGDATERAVRTFQQAEGLVVDGIVGKLTWAALDQALAAKGGQP